MRNLKQGEIRAEIDIEKKQKYMENVFEKVESKVHVCLTVEEIQSSDLSGYSFKVKTGVGS